MSLWTHVLGDGVLGALWVQESTASHVVTTVVSSLLAEQEDTQKKTFTCWINSQLAKVR